MSKAQVSAAPGYSGTPLAGKLGLKPGMVMHVVAGRSLMEAGVWPTLGVCVLLAGLVVFTHRGNLKRLRAGTEPKFGQRVAQQPKG